MADKVDPRTGELTTANYGWVKPTVGASVDAWGGYINTDLDGIDSTVHSIQASVPAASSTTPAMDGTAAVGTGTTYARADHVHPVDTSRYAAANPSGYQTAAQVTASLGPYALTASVPAASSTSPVMDGTAAVGTGVTFARADHVHPSDTSKLSLTGGTLSGALTVSQTAGIVGTTAANNAAVGAIGEYVKGEQQSGVAMTTAANVNIVSISLTAGDWDVEANGQIIPTVGMSAILFAVSTTSATFPSTTSAGVAQHTHTTATQTNFSGPTGPVRVSIAATTTVYLVAQAAFASGSCTGYGTIQARRVR